MRTPTRSVSALSSRPTPSSRRQRRAVSRARPARAVVHSRLDAAGECIETFAEIDGSIAAPQQVAVRQHGCEIAGGRTDAELDPLDHQMSQSRLCSELGHLLAVVGEPPGVVERAEGR